MKMTIIAHTHLFDDALKQTLVEAVICKPAKDNLKYIILNKVFVFFLIIVYNY